MRKKLTSIIILSSFAVFGAVATLTASANTGVVMETKATLGTTSGVVGVELAKDGDNCWYNANAKIGLYFMDSNKAKIGWSSIVQTTEDVSHYLVPFADLSSTPSYMKAVRWNPDVSDETIAADPWGSAKWAEGSWDFAFSDCCYIKGWFADGTSAFNVSPTQKTGSNDGWSSQISTRLENLRINSKSHFEVYSDVRLEENEEFKIVNADSNWIGYYDGSTLPSYVFSGGGENNIVCHVAGTYTLSYDITERYTRIESDSVNAADSYAEYFMANIGCDESGITSPSGWSTIKDAYPSDAQVRNVLYEASGNKNGGAINKCVYWHDYAVAAHADCDSFILNGDGNPRNNSNASASNGLYLTSNNIVEKGFVIGGIVAGLVVTACAFIMIRKKSKE